MKECEVSELTKFVFDKYFNVLTERWSRCRNGRIDFVLQCKQSGALFGVELKSTENKKGEEIGEIVKQCIRYRDYEFMIEEGEYNTLAKFKKLPIFVCPAISNNIFAWVDERITIYDKEYIKDRHKTDHEHHGFNGFLGSFGIGEVRTFSFIEYKTQKTKKYFSMIISNRETWSSKKYNGIIKGLHQKNYEKLIQTL